MSSETAPRLMDVVENRTEVDVEAAQYRTEVDV